MLVFAWGLQAAAGGAELPSVEAPYGLAWGPVTEVPRPTLVDREANITALIYFQGQAPALGERPRIDRDRGGLRRRGDAVALPRRGRCRGWQGADDEGSGADRADESGLQTAS